MGVRATARRALARSGALSLLLCDDVLTTGATAREAQRALEEAGLPVRAVVTVAATRKRLPARRAP
jgi:predicted amidophosphoribosyltransferase